jgi:hypothetical protein
MASFSLRSLHKLLLILLAASLILASFNLQVIFNKQFLKIKNTIEKESSAILKKNVKIRDIEFLPYGEITLKNIKIQDQRERLSYVEIEKFSIRFNVLEFLINKNAIIAKRKKSKEFNLKGAMVFKKPGFIGPMGYKLGIIMTPDVISISDLRLDFEKFSVDIKGVISDYASSPKAELDISSKEINIRGVGRVTNLYSRTILSKDGLFIKNLDFFVNNFPLGITCRLSDFKSPVIELNIVSYPGQLPSLRPFNPFNFELN